MLITRGGLVPKRPAKNLYSGGRTMPVWSDAQSKFGGGSLYFDGSAKNAFSIRPGNFDWGTAGTGQNGLNGGLQPGGSAANKGEFTWECWLYRITNTGEAQWWEAGSGGLSLGIKDGTGFWAGVSQSTYGFFTTTGSTTGQWQHYCVTRDSGGQVRIYIDGTYRTGGNSGTYNGASSIGSNPAVQTPFVGGQANTPYINGYMNELRVSNINRYVVVGNANITVPTAPFVNDGNTLLLVHGTQGPVDDNS